MPRPSISLEVGEAGDGANIAGEAAGDDAPDCFTEDTAGVVADDAPIDIGVSDAEWLLENGRERLRRILGARARCARAIVCWSGGQAATGRCSAHYEGVTQRRVPAFAKPVAIQYAPP